MSKVKRYNKSVIIDSETHLLLKRVQVKRYVEMNRTGLVSDSGNSLNDVVRVLCEGYLGCGDESVDDSVNDLVDADSDNKLLSSETKVLSGTDFKSPFLSVSVHDVSSVGSGTGIAQPEIVGDGLLEPELDELLPVSKPELVLAEEDD